MPTGRVNSREPGGEMAVAAARERAPYACDPAASRGRLHGEAEAPHRNAFRRDGDRVIHSTAFRRLKRKTQVFVAGDNDHYRTRLTHTLEVSQIARALARALGLDEDLAEALALAHDLGHPPFGHAGEAMLDECLAPHGGFDHNVQTLRVVTRLERRYAAFDGLNLTRETLEGLAKHNGPLPAGAPMRAYAERFAILPDGQGSGEAQAAAIADDIAYDAHDLDDGLRAGLFVIEELGGLPLLGELIAEVRGRYPALEPARAGHEIVRRLIARMIADVVRSAEARIRALDPSSPDALRMADSPVVAFSPALAEADRAIKGFLFPRMYRHERVLAAIGRAQGVVRDLFGHYAATPGDLPDDWRSGIADLGPAARARRIGDFIAGMTDGFALATHARLFDSRLQLG